MSTNNLTVIICSSNADVRFLGSLESFKEILGSCDVIVNYVSIGNIMRKMFRCIYDSLVCTNSSVKLPFADLPPANLRLCNTASLFLSKHIYVGMSYYSLSLAPPMHSRKYVAADDHQRVFEFTYLLRHKRFFPVELPHRCRFSKLLQRFDFSRL